MNHNKLKVIQELGQSIDRPVLVEAAQKLGIPGFHHRTFSTTKSILEDFKNAK